jgi:uncharacterized protein YegL
MISRNSAHVLGLLAALVLLAPAALGGDGKYSVALGTWDFGISMRFDATTQQLERTETEFQKASLLIYDASDGQQEFGDVFCCDMKGAGKAAEVWVLAPGNAWLSRAPGRFGVSGQHIELCYDDMVYSNAKADGSWVVAHEWGHHAYGIKDEYSGPTNGAKECVVVPAAVADRTACLIENFWNHGADGVSLTEWCVASNHDPNNDTWQEDINGQSCWENLVDAYPDVTAPAALPDAGPTTNPIEFFDWTLLMEGTRIVLVIDDSGSMINDNKMELAKLGGKIFANLAKDGQKMGVVRFDGSASTAYALTVMDNATRAAAKAAIDGLNAGGSTDIDEALDLALGLITGDGERSCQQAIVLLSDGSQGGPVNAGLIENMVTNGVVVHAIALGPSGVDIPTMQGVASGTGGKYFYADNGAVLPGIFAQLSAETAEGGVLNTANGTLSPGDSTTVDFEVDETTNEIAFVASWDTGDLAVTLDGPSQSFDSSTKDPDFTFTTDSTAVTMVVRGALVEPGTWTVGLGPSVDPGGLIAFEVQAISDSKELTFQATSDTQAYTYPAPMFLEAQATFDKAITGIDVTGIVQRPDGSEAEVVLRDDGSASSGDAEAGDGVYTGRFDTWADDGEYTVEITAVNDGGGQLTGGEGLIPDGEVAISGDTPPDFLRSSGFSVSLNGAPFLQRFGLGVDKFKVGMHAKTDAKNKVTVKSAVNLAEGSVDPTVDMLTLSVGNLDDYDFLPGDLKQAGKKPRYVFKDKASGVSGYVDLFGKGTSKGKFAFADKGFPSGFGFGGFGGLGSVNVEFEWGDMDYTATLSPNVNKKGTASSFSGKKDTYASEEAWVSSVKVGVNTKKADKDKLSLRAKLAGGLFGSFNPLGNDSTIALGPWSVDIPAAAWKANKKGTKLTYVSDDKAIKVTYDTEREELAITAKNQDLSTITATVQFNVTSGLYTHRREFKMAANKKGTAFTF